MSKRATTGWIQDSFTMFKHRPPDRSYTCRPPEVFSDWETQPGQMDHEHDQKGAESNGYLSWYGSR